MKEKHLNGHELHPETLALSYGYDPKLSEGSIKPPIFLTSTFQFNSAEDGKSFFELAYGLRTKNEGEIPGLIYSRINNPNLQIFEERIAIWDKAEMGAVFASGMAAISTTMWAILRPGDAVLSSCPIYGGTHYLFQKILPQFGITTSQVACGRNVADELRREAEKVGIEKVRVLYIETPANPSNLLIDIAAVAEVAAELTQRTGKKVYTVVDNTFLGPIFQTPSLHGADLTIYSATKFIGGHSDLVAGVVTGPKAIMDLITGFRTILGTVATPFTGWLLLRSLETLSVRMRRQEKSARTIADYLKGHPKVSQVLYPGLLDPSDPQFAVYEKQCTGAGSLISFEVKGGEEEAFKVLNRFKICRLAVSLGGTESLVEHPMTMTHSDIPRAELELINVTPGLIRISVGIEHEDDLLADLAQALG
ncbi:MAG: cystathionine gamma-synthase family protein [Proteobacteria bacterium]|nr:MAG: cystathionine gamma-synthase family protein [Pseudomonadota bacterium]